MIRITSPTFVAGVDIDAQRAAPILSFMRLWTYGQIVRYCERKGWQWERIA